MPPPVGSRDVPPFHGLSGLEFQALCNNLLDAGLDPQYSRCQERGTSGQSQQGVDLIAYRNDGGIDVIQCKCESSFSVAKIRGASKEFLQYVDMWKARDLRRFIVAVGCRVNRRQEVDETDDQRRSFAKLGIDYELWDAVHLANKLRPHRALVSQHFSSAWTDYICGHSNASALGQALAKEAAFNSSLTTLVIDFADKELSEIRELWRSGARREASSRMNAIRTDRVAWNILAAKTQAAYIRFEASLVLDGEDDDVRAEALLEEADKLFPSLDDSARLRAALLWRAGKIEAAVASLEGVNADGPRHFKALLLLGLRRAEDALLALKEVKEINAETHQLRSLCHLAADRIGEAQVSIRRALQMRPQWTFVRWTAAAIDYFCAVAPAVRRGIGLLPPWPEPVSAFYVLPGADAQSKLRRAFEQFDSLLHSDELTEDERGCLEAWKVACLALDTDRQPEFESEVAAILGANLRQHRVMAWAVVSGLRAQAEESAEALRQLSIDGTASIEQVLVLTQYYLIGGDLKRAERLLRQKKTLFAQPTTQALWSVWNAQVQAQLGHLETALKQIDILSLQDTESRLLKGRVMILGSEDTQVISRFLDDSYSATGDARFLLDLVEHAAKHSDWVSAADRSKELVRLIPTAEILRLTAYSAYKAERYSLCLELLKEGELAFAGSNLPGDLRKLRVNSQRELGLLPAALFEAERLAQDDPSLENLMGLVRGCLSAGDFRRLCLAAESILSLERVPAESLLIVSAQVRSHDHRLAVQLWRRACDASLPDELVVNAALLGSTLGLDRECRSLFRRVEELGRTDGRIVRFASLEELKEHFQAQFDHAREMNAAYLAAQCPIHLIAPTLNHTIAWYYHTQFEDNSRAPFLFTQPLTFVRSGRRQQSSGDSKATEETIYADVTAILLAQHFRFLGEIEKAFPTIRVPASLIPSLIQMHDALTQAQVERFASYRRILDAFRIGKIRQPHSTESDSALEGFIQAAKREGGIVVDFEPGINDGGSADQNTATVVGIKSILRTLRDCGRITTDRYQELSELDSIAASPDTPVRYLSGKLFCKGTTVEALASFGVLDVASDQFQIFMEHREIVRIEEELNLYDRRQALSFWVGDLIAHLNRAMNAGKYQVISTEALAPTAVGGFQESDQSADCLVTLMRVKEDPSGRVWIDDRFANHHLTLGQMPITDSVELLRELSEHGTISSQQCFDILSRMRAEGACFVPVSSDEIIHHLLSAELAGDALLESTGLRNLRRGVAASLLAANFLRSENMEVAQGAVPGEYGYLVRSLGAITDALSRLWFRENLDEDTRTNAADWIIENLFVPHHAMRRIAGQVLGGADSLTFATSAASLLTHSMKYSANRAEREVIGSFANWMYERLLERHFEVDPVLLDQTATYLRDLLDRIWPKDILESHKDVASEVVLRHIQGLPRPVQSVISTEPEFLAKLGLSMRRVVEIEGIQFERTAYFRAAKAAVNGSESTARLLDSDIDVKFLPFEPKGAGIRLLVPDRPAAIDVCDWINGFLVESLEARVHFVLDHQDLFDLPESGREALLELASTEGALRRIDRAEECLELSLPHFYRSLESKLRRNSSFKMAEFFPKNPVALLRFLRLEQKTDATDFSTQMLDATRRMTESLPIVEALDRLLRLPIALTSEVVDRVKGLPTQDRQELIHSLLKREASPLWQIQFRRLVDQCFTADERPPVVHDLLAQSKACSAYLTVVRWVFDELTARNETLGLPGPVLLAASWSHGDRLFCMLRSKGVSEDRLDRDFGLSPARVANLIRSEGPLVGDVANPHNVSFETLCLCGLCRISGTANELLELCELTPGWPKWSLLPGIAGRSNAIGSFLHTDRLALYLALRNEKDAAKAEELRAELEQLGLSRLANQDDFGWAALRGALGKEPEPERNVENIRSAFLTWDFVGRANVSINTSIEMLHVAGTILKWVVDDHVKSRFEQQLFGLAREWSKRGQNQELVGGLLEAALNLACCEGEAGLRCARFAELMAGLATVQPTLTEIVKPIVQGLCQNLPLELTAEIWRLNLRLRTR